MAKIGTYPTTFEQRKSVSISDLRKWGYLKPGSWQSGTITWSRNGEITSQINIAVNMQSDRPYLELSYNWQEQSKRYKVFLIPAPSNLGKGRIWFFHCPFTNKRCRKLYFIGGHFQHREAINGYYDKQIQSKYYRYLEKIYGPYFKSDDLYSELHSRHFRRFYKGKPTKRFVKICRQLKAAEGVNENDLVNEMTRHK
ncbi:MAG TPA: hypothetical protein VM802_01425 [Chitinophaga sp.]|uniref:hypothetical protein n=1 Tax=Chitinophaga sp. TaxID=1869181 RepID=UPI002CF59A53|nr:hypothetical protein [Chitinophaga sp.]HVI43492.1 hypothetical protein [Chitinophaga sp.]